GEGGWEREGGRGGGGSKGGDIGYPDRVRGGERSGRAPASYQAWRDRAATSPACRPKPPILPASGSNSCERLSPVCAIWRSCPMPAIPPRCWKWAKLSPQPARLASMLFDSKFGERRISRLPSRRSRVAPRRFMLLPIRF